MINICFNLDEKYTMPCRVLMRMIEDKTDEKITFHLIGIDKTDMGCKSLCRFYPKPDLSIFKSENLSNYYYFSQAAMYRLLIPFMIDADKVIYMDIDTAVFDDIGKMWRKRVDYAGAIIDPCDIFHRERLRLPAEHYYNSGVIIFNSKKIREEMPNYKDLVLKAQNEYVLDLKDQDIFNIVFMGHITTLGYEWNIDAHNLKEPREPKQVSNKKDKAFKNPKIVHCMGKEKWWNFEGLAYGKYWDNYAADNIPQNRKRCIKVGNMLLVRN